ncbi:putative small lipoprotein YifL [Bacillus aryabhattai]|jgi:predicted small lipoprotein YifL|uniref:Small lipoprotein YifL n=1 Tax=Priestia aryabhattai TaxID=412384 RepID=A0A7W3N816_PRIAR|nr:putative small lipoprotein YifL [Priestia aryabhattai]
MKKIVTRSLVAAALFTSLAACEDKQGDTHVAYKTP